MPPRLSILLPVFDAEATLLTCLRSIQRQRWTDFECVVVDDGSSDASGRIAESVAEHDCRFRLVRQSHAGLIAALEAGRRACRGSLVARMDADDWMHRDRLRLQVEMLDARPDLAAIGCHVRIFPRRGLSEGRRRYEAWLNSLTDEEAVHRDRFIECPIAHPSLMIRREILDDLGYRETGWPEDHDLMLRLMDHGAQVGTLPRRLLGWRDRPDRLSRTDPRYALDRFTQGRAWHLSRSFLTGQRGYVLWGYGDTGRALRKALAQYGQHPVQIIEVHPGRIGQTIHGAPVVSPDALETKAAHPIIVSVAGAEPRREIRTALDRMGYAESIDFVCTA